MFDGLIVFLIGFSMVMLPSIMALRDGVRDEGDLAHWLSQQPYQFLMLVRATTMMGFLLMAVGVLRAVQMSTIYWGS